MDYKIGLKKKLYNFSDQQFKIEDFYLFNCLRDFY